MKSLTRRWLLAALPAALIPTSLGCHPADSEDVTEPTRSAEVDIEELDGLRVEFALENDAATPTELEAAARHVETLADVAAAKVKVEKNSEEATVVVVEMWGRDFPSEDAIAQSMRAQFPFLKDAIITTNALRPEDRPIMGAARDKAEEEEDPEVAKQRIIDELRAKGVEGEIHVDVVDDDNGERRVEVRVEKHEDSDLEGR